MYLEEKYNEYQDSYIEYDIYKKKTTNIFEMDRIRRLGRNTSIMLGTMV